MTSEIKHTTQKTVGEILIEGKDKKFFPQRTNNALAKAICPDCEAAIKREYIDKGIPVPAYVSPETALIMEYGPNKGYKIHSCTCGMRRFFRPESKEDKTARLKAQKAAKQTKQSYTPPEKPTVRTCVVKDCDEPLPADRKSYCYIHRPPTHDKTPVQEDARGEAPINY